jgi:hypothetical protein
MQILANLDLISAQADSVRTLTVPVEIPSMQVSPAKAIVKV